MMQHPYPHLPPPLLPTAPKTVRYNSRLTRNGYLLNTTLADVYSHQAACVAQGAHLVSYTSEQEQVGAGGCAGQPYQRTNKQDRTTTQQP